ncbi:M23 family metallopeptidase [Carbonactinospora thermoautotrophica]|uniref:M23 family metallopeptidase n=1 Tax=Carbonactinospora thermoautotrophica TaxID=1469144 RepID=UPI00226F19D4|nr:peptidoglycan DD-metalloendopeptidase family protein [Carbonactinospora thermoautotrophica]
MAGKHRRATAPTSRRSQLNAAGIQPLPPQRAQGRVHSRIERRPEQRPPGRPASLGATPFAVAGVAAVAVAAVGGVALPGTDVEAARADAAAADLALQRIPLDQQLHALRSDASALAERASRAQERLELKEAQERARRLAEEQRRRAELLRPKYALPISGDYVITATFGDSGSRWSTVHKGLDFAVPSGTKVRAVADGTIIKAGWDHWWGWHMVVRHKDGTESYYCHLSSFVRRRGPVKAGETIARSGNTGNSSGPHLHLEIHIDGNPVDPARWLRKHGLDP